MRVGLLLEGGNYEYFDQTNPDGRTTYASLNDYDIDRKLQSHAASARSRRPSLSTSSASTCRTTSR